MATLEQIATNIERCINAKLAPRWRPGQPLPVQSVGGKVLPGFVEILFQLSPTTKVNAVRMLENDIAMAAGSASTRVTQSGAHLAIQIPTANSAPVMLSDLMTRDHELPPYTMTLGVCSDGSPLHLVLPSPDVAHVLIAGTTGSGKSVAAHTLITSLAARCRPSQLAIVVIDPKRRVESAFLNNIRPYLAAPPAVETKDMLHVIGRAVNAMENKVIGVPAPRVVIFIDELADVLMQGGKKMEEYITRIAQRGREPGFHLIAATQKPTTKAIGTLLKANLPTRLIGRVINASDSNAASGIPDLQAHRLPGRGAFIAVVAGQTLRVQVAVSDVTIKAPVMYQAPKSQPQPMQQVVEQISAPVEVPPAPWLPDDPEPQPADERGAEEEKLLNDIVAYLRANPNASNSKVCVDVYKRAYSGQHRTFKIQRLVTAAKEIIKTGSSNIVASPVRSRKDDFAVAVSLFRANARFEVELTDEQITDLMNGECHYCGDAPRIYREGGRDVLRNGIDRVDSSLGYVPGNVVTCCGTCNKMKLDHDEQWWISHMRKIIAHVDKRPH